MKRILASLAFGAVVVGGMISPAFADAYDSGMTAEITKVTSSSSQTTSLVSVSGTWESDQLSVGQNFVVEATDFIAWNADFPFTLDSGEQIGNCVIDNAKLTCSVDRVPESTIGLSNITGHWWAKARVTDNAIGKTSGEITLNGKTTPYVFGDTNGDGTCDNDCNGVHYENAGVENVKWGWTNSDGSVSWLIKWIVEPNAEYTIHDEYMELSTKVKCARSATWDPATTENLEATRIDANTVKMTAPEGAKVCLTYPVGSMRPAEGEKTVTNVATVNSMKFEKTVEIQFSGGTDGDGHHASTTPDPTPTPTPEPTPSTTPAPTPSATPTPTPEPTPSTTPTPTPSTTPTPTPEPTPSTTPAPTPSATLVRLPVTGAAGSVAASAAIALLALGGFFAFWARRRAARSE